MGNEREPWVGDFKIVIVTKLNIEMENCVYFEISQFGPSMTLGFVVG